MTDKFRKMALAKALPVGTGVPTKYRQPGSAFCLSVVVGIGLPTRKVVLRLSLLALSVVGTRSRSFARL